jgi:hypothetical protein
MRTDKLLLEEGEVNGVSPTHPLASGDGDARADTPRAAHASGSPVDERAVSRAFANNARAARQQGDV